MEGETVAVWEKLHSCLGLKARQRYGRCEKYIDMTSGGRNQADTDGTNGRMGKWDLHYCI